MNHIWAIADEDIKRGDAVILDPATGRVKKANKDDVESPLDRMKRISQVDDKGFYLYPNEPENQ